MSVKSLVMSQMAGALLASGYLVETDGDKAIIRPEKSEPPMPNGVVLANDLRTYPISEKAVEKLTAKTARTIHDVERMMKAEAKRARRAAKSNDSKGGQS